MAMVMIALDLERVGLEGISLATAVHVTDCRAASGIGTTGGCSLGICDQSPIVAGGGGQ